VPAELQQPVAVRGLVTVKAPHAPLRGGTGKARGAQPADDRAVHRLPVVQRGLGCVDHQLVPQRQAALVGAGQGGRRAQQLSVPLADPDPLQCQQRPPQQAAELGQHPADACARADGDEHHRRPGVAAEERGPLALPVRGPVDAEQRGRPGDAAPVQQVAHGHESRHPVHALLAPQVDGQLGLFVHLIEQRHRLDLAGCGVAAQQPRPLQGNEPGPGDPRGRVDQWLDPGAAVDRDRGERQVLRQGQRPVRARMTLRAETLGPAQQDARRDLMPPVQVEQRVGGESVARDPAAFTEVAGELDGVLVHCGGAVHR